MPCWFGVAKEYSTTFAEILKDYQTLFAGVLGFGGVIAAIIAQGKQACTFPA